MVPAVLEDLRVSPMAPPGPGNRCSGRVSEAQASALVRLDLPLQLPARLEHAVLRVLPVDVRRELPVARLPGL
eukprot:5319147-Alexandrium_andersonii.AAC.1